MPPPISPTSAIRHEVQPGIWLDSRLAVWLATERLLVVADLHWGYAASHRARGNLLPLWGDDEIDSRLRSLVVDYSPKEMLWLGDIVHAAEGAERAERFLAHAPCPVTVLAGNHDRRWRGAQERIAVKGRFVFHHGDAPLQAGALADLSRSAGDGACVEVIGHYHPAATWWDGAGGNVKLPALLVSPQRLILPAFSPWAAGTDCATLLEAGSTVWAVSPKRIFAVPPRHRLSAAV